jgi:hypothetical protein
MMFSINVLLKNHAWRPRHDLFRAITTLWTSCQLRISELETLYVIISNDFEITHSFDQCNRSTRVCKLSGTMLWNRTTLAAFALLLLNRTVVASSVDLVVKPWSSTSFLDFVLLSKPDLAKHRALEFGE